MILVDRLIGFGFALRNRMLQLLNAVNAVARMPSNFTFASATRQGAEMRSRVDGVTNGTIGRFGVFQSVEMPIGDQTVWSM